MNHILILFKGPEDVSSTMLFTSWAEANDWLEWSWAKRSNYDTDNLTYTNLITHARIDRIDGFGRYKQGKDYIYND